MPSHELPGFGRRLSEFAESLRTSLVQLRAAGDQLTARARDLEPALPPTTERRLLILIDAAAVRVSTTAVYVDPTRMTDVDGQVDPDHIRASHRALDMVNEMLCYGIADWADEPDDNGARLLKLTGAGEVDLDEARRGD